MIDTACRRILSTQLRFAAAEDPLPAYPIELVAGDAHRALALEAAEKSAVLLENDGALPFDRASIGKLAVLGKLAALVNTGDNGSSRVRAPYVVTPLEGLRALLGADAVVTGDEDDLAAARTAAASADAVVVVVGYTAQEEGEFIPGDIVLGQEGSAAALPELPEAVKVARANAPPRPVAIGGDRIDLGLNPEQHALIVAAAQSGKPVVVVIVAGSAVMVEGWRGHANAILQTFYAGMEGGTALARLLFGAVSPSGKLPFTVAREVADYPPFDRDAKVAEYGYWHGYAKFEREGLTPRYAFGHGLSYTAFEYRAVRAERLGDAISVSVAVHNAGAVASAEIVQCYFGYPGTVQPRAAKLLKAFARVHLGAGETRIVHMEIALDDLRYRDPATHTWRLEPGAHVVFVGGSSNDLSEGVVIDL